MVDALRSDEVLQVRLANQQLARPHLADVARLVGHLGAVQSQDYAAAKWALGQRLRSTTDEAIERAFNAGAIVRTHVLRPTWHFVAPDDLRWLLALTGPRVKSMMASNDRLIGLDAELLGRSTSVIGRALEGGKQLGRRELAAALQEAGIGARDTQTLSHLLVHAELDGVICSGAWRGKQWTYSLVDERIAPSRGFDRDAALAELTGRYFTSHGPATVRDFAWWSGLTMADTRRGLELNGRRFVSEVVDGLTYWFAPPAKAAARQMPIAAYLLPNYDEYTVAYRERDLFYAPGPSWTPGSRADIPFGNVIVMAGRVVGMWKRTLRRAGLMLETRWFDEPSETQRSAVAEAAERFGAFYGVALELRV